jgi:hypothetical protein
MFGVSIAIIGILAQLRPSVLKDIGLAGASLGLVLFGYLLLVDFQDAKHN